MQDDLTTAREALVEAVEGLDAALQEYVAYLATGAPANAPGRPAKSLEFDERLTSAYADVDLSAVLAALSAPAAGAGEWRSECGGFLRDQASILREDAAYVVGGQRNRLLAEADDCERWAAMLAAPPPPSLLRSDHIADADKMVAASPDPETMGGAEHG